MTLDARVSCRVSKVLSFHQLYRMQRLAKRQIKFSLEYVINGDSATRQKRSGHRPRRRSPRCERHSAQVSFRRGGMQSFPRAGYGQVKSICEQGFCAVTEAGIATARLDLSRCCRLHPRMMQFLAGSDFKV